MTFPLTPRERELARHALGLDGSSKITTRNYAFVSEDTDELWIWVNMTCRLFAIRKRQVGGWSIRLTRAGALAALEPGETLNSEDFQDER